MYVFSAVPGSAGILAGEATNQHSSPARMPALPGTPLNTYFGGEGWGEEAVCSRASYFNGSGAWVRANIIFNGILTA